MNGGQEARVYREVVKMPVIVCQGCGGAGCEKCAQIGYIFVESSTDPHSRGDYPIRWVSSELENK
ncbi:MAG: hypothetical protein NVS1B6_04370 [Steroidobacteraceae bacterium]